ncbi:hypothetical protein CLV31_10419 [Algoriphagus aquaeductus]|uniref:Uncharacterized protein n=1 Tax=Algoriphagus aquaeductus TaxID=475299 RepID=A0A326RT31_9BACT|nr:hypothetical protein CLV31_10419 [Algoriphagus aquaeductus]
MGDQAVRRLLTVGSKPEDLNGLWSTAKGRFCKSPKFNFGLDVKDGREER